MKLYHGSTIEVMEPILLKKQRLLDFGQGLYTTTNQIQAERWASLKRNRAVDNSIQAFVNVYKLSNMIFADKRFAIKEFEIADSDWLDFIYANRYGKIKHEYDIVIGPVANDTLYATLSLYEAGILNKGETIKRLKSHVLFDQVSFHSQKALNELQYFGSYELE
jgi:hypothetical protein